MICDYFFMPVNKATVSLPFSAKRRIVSRSPIFNFPSLVLAVWIHDKHLYLSWERANSQLEGQSAADLNVLCWRMIKQTLVFINSQAVWQRWIVLPALKLNHTHCSLNILLIPSVYCCGLAHTQLSDIYLKALGSRIREHPPEQPLLTALRETKPNQMCVWGWIVTTPSDSASVSLLCRDFTFTPGVLRSLS